MTLMRYRPMNDLFSFQNDVNRLFEELGRRGASNAPTLWSPPVDLRENETEFSLIAELPGLKKEDIKISFNDNMLILRGEKKAETREENENWHHVERTYGSFERTVQLTAPVAIDKVTARFEDGVLTVVLPKSEEAKPREIGIE